MSQRSFGDMGAEGSFLRLLARPCMPRFLVEGLVRAFAMWHVRQVTGSDRAAEHESLGKRSTGKRPTTVDHPIYLLDGYHGGIPFWDWLLLPQGGLWRMLLWPAVGEVLVRRARGAHLPSTLEIDGYTYSKMSSLQPEALARLKGVVGEGEIEVVNGTYGQPFLRTLSGEAILRQFDHGLAAIEDALGVTVTSYASQEPCFCAQLPQILTGFGIQRALLRTHWAPFGQEATHDAALVRWKGPDGSAILTVPRHSWMDYETRRDLFPGALRANLTGAHADGWTEAELGRSSRLAGEHGSAPLLLSKLEDLSPAESPTLAAASLAADPELRLVSLAEYCRIAQGGREPETLPVWQLTPDDLTLDLPWGLEADGLMQARDEAEAALLLAERADALAHTLGGITREDDLQEAWEQLLLAQHHDLHVCGPWLSRAHGKPMSEVGGELCAQAEERARGVMRTALASVLEQVATDQFAGSAVLVFNPEAEARRVVTRVGVDLDAGGQKAGAGLRAYDGDQALPTQVTEEGVAFVCEVPALGWRVLDLREEAQLCHEAPETGCAFGNGFYEARLGEDGALSLSAGGQELMGKGATLQMWREGQWWHSTDSLPVCEVLASGPVFTRWRVCGSVGGVSFEKVLTLYRVLPRLDVTICLDCGPGLAFGPQPEGEAGAYAQDEGKLCARFPVAGISSTAPGRVVVDAPFLVAETGRWRFIGGHWAAVEGEDWGLAVLAPGARGYTYDPDEGVLHRVLAWSPRTWMYASDDSVTPGGSLHPLLRGQHWLHYALLPYRHRSEVVAGAADYCLPVPVMCGQASPGRLGISGSLLSIEGEGVVLSALFLRGGETYARLWNASGMPREVGVHSQGNGELVAVGLRMQEGERLARGRLALRPWGVQTVRVPRLAGTREEEYSR